MHSAEHYNGVHLTEKMTCQIITECSKITKTVFKLYMIGIPLHIFFLSCMGIKTNEIPDEHTWQ